VTAADRAGAVQAQTVKRIAELPAVSTASAPENPIGDNTSRPAATLRQ